jgi:hypothetical protein
VMAMAKTPSEKASTLPVSVFKEQLPPHAMGA